MWSSFQLCYGFTRPCCLSQSFQWSKWRKKFWHLNSITSALNAVNVHSSPNNCFSGHWFHSPPRWLSIDWVEVYEFSVRSRAWHSPAQSKRAVVKTVMDRVRHPASSTKERISEEQRVVSDLKTKKYPAKFIWGSMRRERESNKIRSFEWHNSFRLNLLYWRSLKEFCVCWAKRMLGPLFVRSKHLVYWDSPQENIYINITILWRDWGDEQSRASIETYPLGSKR